MSSRNAKGEGKRTLLFRAVSVAVAVLLWQGVSMLLGQKLLLPSPVDVVVRLGTLVTDPAFFGRVGYSFLRIELGFLLALVVGTGLALLAGRFRAVEIALFPYMLTVKTVPVASFIILAFVWLTSSGLSVFISFLMVLPVVYSNLLGGIRGMDGKMEEMAKVFRMPLVRRIGYVWIPALKTPFLTACSLALGLSWKAGVAAEVIGVPQGSLGEQLYYAKVYFDTVDLFAWTVVILLCSVAFEKLFLAAVRGGFALWEKRASPRPSSIAPTVPSPAAVTLRDVSRLFDEKVALAPVSAIVAPGSVVCVRGPSGAGKTTLLRLLAGLDTPSGGEVSGVARPSVVFQEDRIPGCFSAVTAVTMASPTASPDDARALLGELGLGGVCSSCVDTFSGGMKRRVAIARALLAPSDVLLFDEPFKGLDDETRKTVVETVLRRRRERTLLVVTHDEEDVALLGAETLTLEQ